VATYKGVDATAPLVQWFWEVMEEFSNAERSLFLRFVWGRTRLPRTIADFRGRDFVLQVNEYGNSLFLRYMFKMHVLIGLCIGKETTQIIILSMFILCCLACNQNQIWHC
jgi:hypothetical protein